MIKQSEEMQIKKLIKSGFDLELISFELDIPIEQIKECKKELSRTEPVKRQGRTYNPSGMEEMKERYKEVYFGTTKPQVRKNKKELSEEEIQLVNSIISTVEEQVNEIKNSVPAERIQIIKKLLLEVQKVEKCEMLLEQAEKLNTLLHCKEIQAFKLRTIDKLGYKIERSTNKISERLADSIDIKQLETENLEELKVLQSKITMDMALQNPTTVGYVRDKISNKISKIEQKKTFDRIRNDIPVNILELITELTNGSINIESAKETIEREARKIVESKPKTRFSLTQEQEKKQLLIKIRTAIMDKADQYHINNPEVVILQMQKICGGQQEQNIRAVVKNLVARKEFESAKNICNEFIDINIEERMIKDKLIALKDEIKNAEIGDMILKGIKMKGTPEEERKYFELIETGLKKGNVKLHAISLGKNYDGSKDITLADIYTKKEEKEILI